jgi:hypothetical protein
MVVAVAVNLAPLARQRRHEEIGDSDRRELAIDTTFGKLGGDNNRTFWALVVH